MSCYLSRAYEMLFKSQDTISMPVGSPKASSSFPVMEGGLCTPDFYSTEISPQRWAAWA